MDIENLARKLNGLKAEEVLYVLKNGAVLAEKGGTCEYVTESTRIHLPQIDGPLTAEELIPLLR